ncbi:MAG: hypothetical protein EGR93_07475 [Prevotella sp.]|nr:hypothetical protein [Prevotella sp.]
MFFKDFVSVKRKKIKKGASQTYDTPSFFCLPGTTFIFACPGKNFCVGTQKFFLGQTVIFPQGQT